MGFLAKDFLIGGAIAGCTWMANNRRRAKGENFKIGHYPAVLRLAVAEHPDVGGDAGVVEYVEGQGDDSPPASRSR